MLALNGDWLILKITAGIGSDIKTRQPRSQGGAQDI